jgi:serine O-acetyltransferase
MQRRTHPYDRNISNGAYARWLIALTRKRTPGLTRLFMGYLNCDIGVALPEDIFLPHPYGIVMSAFCTFGADVVIGHQVTLGNRNGETGAPKIGNRVYIGAGAKVLGPVTIGEDAMIGANAVVTVDVPAGMVAVGANRILPLKGNYWKKNP